MGRLNNAIDDGVNRWAREVAVAHDLVDAPLLWRLTRYERKIKGSPRTNCPPEAASVILARWAHVLGLSERPPTNRLDAGKLIYAGKIDNLEVELVAVIDRAANHDARMALGRGITLWSVIQDRRQVHVGPPPLNLTAGDALPDTGVTDPSVAGILTDPVLDTYPEPHEVLELRSTNVDTTSGADVRPLRWLFAVTDAPHATPDAHGHTTTTLLHRERTDPHRLSDS